MYENSNADGSQDEGYKNDDGMSNGSGSGSGSANYKSRRRSKKDNEGRNFKCDKCDKTYLSYPALYTHTKLKHSDGNDGKPVLPVFSGRGRGRPRKNVSYYSQFFEFPNATINRTTNESIPPRRTISNVTVEKVAQAIQSMGSKKF